MVATMPDTTPTPESPAAPRAPSDDLMRRLNMVASRVEEVVDAGYDARERLNRLEQRIEEANTRQNAAFEGFEQRLEERLTPRVIEAVRGTVGPELASFRGPLEAQAVRLASVENRLERVETIQVDSMNALDVRFGDLAYQTRLALSAGGLITLAAMLVVLLR